MSACRVKRIKKPGIYQLSAADYHADQCTPTPALSASLAKELLARSPAHARWMSPRLNPAYVREESQAFDLGTAVHDSLLEGIDRVEVIDAPDWRTNAAKEARDIARVKGRLPILKKHYDSLAVAVTHAMAAFADCEDIGIPLRDGLVEQSVYAHDIGTWTRCRPDWMAPDHSLVVDVKTTSGSAHPSAFSRQIVNMGYHIQSQFYRRVIRAATGKTPRFLFLAIELDPPYGCSLHSLAPSLEALADEQVEHAIRLWAQCIHENHWPSYGCRVCYAEAPGYTMNQWEEQKAMGEGVEFYEKLFGRPHAV